MDAGAENFPTPPCSQESFSDVHEEEIKPIISQLNISLLATGNENPRSLRKSVSDAREVNVRDVIGCIWDIVKVMFITLVAPMRWLHAYTARVIDLNILPILFVIAVMGCLIAYILQTELFQTILRASSVLCQLLTLILRSLLAIVETTTSLSIYAGETFSGALALRCIFFQCSVSDSLKSALKEVEHANTMIVSVAILAAHPKILNTYSVKPSFRVANIRESLRLWDTKSSLCLNWTIARKLQRNYASLADFPTNLPTR